MVNLYFILYFYNVFDQFPNSLRIYLLINLIKNLFFLLIFLFLIVRNSKILWWFLIKYFQLYFLMKFIQEMIRMFVSYQYCEIYKFDLFMKLFFCSKMLIKCQVKYKLKTVKTLIFNMLKDLDNLIHCSFFNN